VESVAAWGDLLERKYRSRFIWKTAEDPPKTLIHSFPPTKILWDGTTSKNLHNFFGILTVKFVVVCTQVAAATAKVSAIQSTF
jgi:hypothetical protein